MISVNSGNNFENWHHVFFTYYWPIDCFYVGWKELTFQSHGITHAPLLIYKYIFLMSFSLKLECLYNNHNFYNI